MTALEIVSEISAILGWDKPSTIANTADTNTQRILGCLNRAIAYIAKAHTWQCLQTNASFNVSIDNTSYNKSNGGINLKKLLPDFDYIVNASVFDVSNRQRITYSNAEEFLEQEIISAGTASNKLCTIYGDHIFFLPKISAEGFNVKFRYAVKYPVTETNNNANLAKSFFTKDSDTCRFDDELVLLCGLWKVKAELGLDYAENMGDYERLEESLRNSDVIAPVLRAGRREINPHRLNIPGAGAK
jgi:hypothetical protein